MKYDIRKRMERHKERLSRHLDRAETTPEGCVLWPGTKTTGGYGVFCADGQRLMVHRVMWQLLWDSFIPKELYILHRCGNRACCSPEHLYVAKRVYRHGETSHFQEVPEWELLRYRKGAK